MNKFRMELLDIKFNLNRLLQDANEEEILTESKGVQGFGLVLSNLTGGKYGAVSNDMPPGQIVNNLKNDMAESITIISESDALTNPEGYASIKDLELGFKTFTSYTKPVGRAGAKYSGVQRTSTQETYLEKIWNAIKSVWNKAFEYKWIMIGILVLAAAFVYLAPDSFNRVYNTLMNIPNLIMSKMKNLYQNFSLSGMVNTIVDSIRSVFNFVKETIPGGVYTMLVLAFIFIGIGGYAYMQKTNLPAEQYKQWKTGNKIIDSDIKDGLKIPGMDLPGKHTPQPPSNKERFGVTKPGPYAKPTKNLKR